nr:hypothetical protein GCM10020093_103380 [Planobispora longispora]
MHKNLQTVPNKLALVYHVPVDATDMSLTEEQAALRDAVRSFLSERPDASWRRFAAELGVAGLAVPEEYGGAGCGMAEVAVVCEELGRALAPYPYLSTVVLAAEALRAGGDPSAMARLLPGIADGSRTATVLLPGDADLTLTGGGSPAPPATRWTPRWCWRSPAGNWSRPSPLPARRTRPWTPPARSPP